MKAKSMKLRFLVTLHALWKHSDEKHSMNSVKLNEYLKPYGLECTGRVLPDTIRAMKDFGINIQSKGEWEQYGVWIKDRPLEDEALKNLIFAVTTNPYITKAESERILSALVPLVTTYQEPLLKSSIERTTESRLDDSVCQKYIIIHEAILSGRRVRYRKLSFHYDFDAKELKIGNGRANLFTPKTIHQHDQKVEAVDLSLISEVKSTLNRTIQKVKETAQILAELDPVTCIKKDIHPFFYEGEIVFKCRGPYIRKLYHLFGPPSIPVRKNKHCHYTYTVSNGNITADILHDIASIKEHDIRIIGPKPLVDAIEEYYSTTSKILTSPDII